MEGGQQRIPSPASGSHEMHPPHLQCGKTYSGTRRSNSRKALMSTGAVHEQSKPDLFLLCDDQTTQASPRLRAGSQEACQPRGVKAIAQVSEPCPAMLNQRSISQGYSILREGLQYSYNREYQTPGGSAPTVCCSRLHMSRVGPLFGSISHNNNSSAITGELVPCH